MKKGNILNNKVSVVGAVIFSLVLGVTQNISFAKQETNEITVVKEYKNEKTVEATYDSVELSKTIDKEIVKDVNRVVEVENSVKIKEETKKNALENIGNDKVIVEFVEPKPVAKVSNIVTQNMTTTTNKVTQTTTTTVKPVEAAVIKKVKTVVSNTELMYLACIVFAEAGGESYSGKLAVANVVLNRRKSSKYPNSIYGVISQRGQFGPFRNGSLNRAISKYKKGYFTKGDNGYTQSLMAAKSALNGNNNIANRLSFNGKRYSKARKNQKIIGNHRFW